MTNQVEDLILEIVLRIVQGQSPMINQKKSITLGKETISGIQQLEKQIIRVQKEEGTGRTVIEIVEESLVHEEMRCLTDRMISEEQDGEAAERIADCQVAIIEIMKMISKIVLVTDAPATMKEIMDIIICQHLIRVKRTM